MKKWLIAAIVCGGMGAVGGWYVAEEIKKVYPEEWKEVENPKEIKMYNGKWTKEGSLELIK